MRPNVLLITMDELNGRALGYAGDPVIRTPHIDRLAREGMVFGRAYTTQPLCTPARASIFTGQHVTTHGVTGNLFTGLKAGVRRGTVTFTRLLQQAGYETALIGKRHLAFEDESDTGLDRQDLAESKFDFNPPGMTDDYRRWLASRGHSKEEVATWERPDLDAEYRKYYGAIRFPLDEEFYIDSYIGRRAVEFLQGRRDRPFFLWVSFCSPHHPWDPPARYDELYDPAEIPLPRRLERELQTKPLRQRQYLQNLGRGLPHTTIDKDNFVPEDRIYEKIPEDIQRKMIARYYGTITLVDDRIGQILAALEEQGLKERTIIVFTTDHGDYLGEHYLWFKGAAQYECLVRVPLVVWMPDGRCAGRQCSQLVSLADLAPTVLEWAGADALETDEAAHFRSLLDGLSFTPLMERPDRPLRHELVIGPGPGRSAIVTQRWKYVDNGDDLPELYNLQEDPGELVNLAGRAEHAAVEQDLRRRLMEHFRHPRSRA